MANSRSRENGEHNLPKSKVEYYEEEDYDDEDDALDNL
jgi:hypothetical protein